MARLAIFLGLGPVLGLLSLAVPAAFKAGDPTAVIFSVLLIPYAYFFGLVPALITGLVDALLARLVTPLPRALAAGMVGFLVSAAQFIWISFGETGTSMGQAGVLGIVPGVACSWLASVAGRARTRDVPAAH